MRPSLFALALLALAFGGAGGALALRQGTPVPPAAPKETATPAVTNVRPATEQEWIVEDVVAAIAGMLDASHAPSVDATPASPSDPPQSSAFRVAVGGVSEPLQVVIADHLWSPATFVGIAR